jgi:mRNA (guanine-N7-)-methyltransferase
MSLELHPNDASAAQTLFQTWEYGTDVELEATFQALDLTKWLQVVQYLRSLGLQEEAQPTKLNIMVAGGLRFTLVDEGIIQQYCEDNTLLGKPFHVVLKGKRGATDGPKTEVDWKEYGTRIKLRRELPLAADDVRVRDALAKWATVPKSFRLIKRYSFSSLQHAGLVFDLSLVRQSRRSPRGDFLPAATFAAAEIAKQPIVYEAEVEAVSGATFKSFLTGIATVLRGIQNSFVLTRDITKKNVLEFVAAQTGAAFAAFPGPQPATLERSHIMPDGLLRTGDYNVTDKADGQRCLLVVMKTGSVHIVDTNMTVYGTDIRLGKEAAAEWAGLILDGEWVRQDAKGNKVSRYYAFDVYNGAKGADVTRLPFIVRGSASNKEGTAASRHAVLSSATGALANADRIGVVPKSAAFSVHMKIFHTAMASASASAAAATGDIFTEAAVILDSLAADTPYHSDGLIFTPNNAPLPKSGTWTEQLKWKPAAENTIDFLVMTEKDEGADKIGIKVNEDTNEVVRYKTLRLYVGSNTDPALANPRDTILNQKPLPLPSSLETGEYKPVEFVPQPADPMASVCFMALNAGATDVAGATAASTDLAAMNEVMRCSKTGDPIESRYIVEMAYHPTKAAGWRWEPLRVRWDKTERFQRGQMGRTMNADWVANSIWSSIHSPVTEHMIRTGATEEGEDKDIGTAVKAAVYYQRKVPARDLHRIRGLREFHNRYIKEDILLGKAIQPGAAVFDMTCGMAGDIHKWIRGKAEWVLGTDLAEKNLTDQRDGAYRRYLDQTVRSNGKLPSMLFVQADATQRLSDGGAGQSPLDRAMLRNLWGSSEEVPPYAALFKGKAKDGFDTVACMFSLHYFFKDRHTVDGWLRNISETLRVGGLFVGCCFDGDLVAGLLGDLVYGETKRGVEGGTEVWSITKQYEGNVLPPTDEGVGKPITVNFISIGESYTEYLVSWPYLKERFEAIGLELLNAEELAEIGLQHSTNTFAESYDMAAKTGRGFPMSPTLKTFSFLNRWFILKRRSTGAEIPYSAPGVASALTAADRAEAMGPVGPTGEAPASEDIQAEDQLPDIGGPMLEVQEIGETQEGQELQGMFEQLEAATQREEAAKVEMEETVGNKGKPKTPNNKTNRSKSPAKVVGGKIFKVWQKGELVDDLGLGDKGWRRWMGTYALSPVKDWKDPSVTYPSLEAAFASAKFQIASNRPELGPKLFGIDGEIHQKYALDRANRKKKPTELQEWSLQEDEGDEVRKMMRGTEMKAVGAKLDPKKWEAGFVEVVGAYVQQRYATDARFKAAVDAVKAAGGQVMFYTTPKGNEFSGYEEGGVIKGDNVYGKAIMGV